MTEEIKTNSQEIIEKANKIISIKDDLGRDIRIKQPSITAETQLIELLGKSAENNTLLNYYAPLIYVISLDSAPFLLGSSRRELDAALARLDRVGLKAVMIGISEYFSANNFANELEVKEAVKK